MMVTIQSVDDERSALAEGALRIIERAFPPRDRQPIEQISMEIAEKRRKLLVDPEFQLLAAVGEEGEVLGVSSGMYLRSVNVGFVTYLAVRKRARGHQLGGRLRTALIRGFESDAREVGQPSLAAVVGEVRLESRWLARLYRDRSVLPLDLEYYHPGQTMGEATTRWVLYRQGIADGRSELPAADVRQLLYAIWRRAYRVRWPLSQIGFQTMLAGLEHRDLVGPHPEVGG